MFEGRLFSEVVAQVRGVAEDIEDLAADVPDEALEACLLEFALRLEDLLSAAELAQVERERARRANVFDNMVELERRGLRAF